MKMYLTMGILVSLIALGIPTITKAKKIEQKSEEDSAWEVSPKRVEKLAPGDDRVMIMSTTKTVPKGVLSFSDYEIGLVHLSYGIRDDLQVSMFMSLPVLQIVLGPSIKWRMVNTKWFRFAVLGYGGLGYWYAVEHWQIYFTGLGAIGDVCLDASCNSLLSFNITPQYTNLNFEVWDVEGTDTRLNIFGLSSSIGVIGTVSQRIKLLGEFRYSFGAPFKDFHDNGSIFSIHYGMRIYGSEFAADIGFIRPFLALSGTEPFSLEEGMKYIPMGFPWLSFTYQW